MIAHGATVSPTSRTTLSLEYGYASRLNEDDAVYAGGARTYPGTERVPGQHIGNLSRLTGTWSAGRHLSLRLNLEHLQAGSILRAAGFSSGTHAYLDATFRY